KAKENGKSGGSSLMSTSWSRDEDGGGPPRPGSGSQADLPDGGPAEEVDGVDESDGLPSEVHHDGMCAGTLGEIAHSAEEVAFRHPRGHHVHRRGGQVAGRAE